MGLFDVLGKVAGVAAAPVTGGASLTPMLIGAGLGAGKHFLIDKPNEEKSAKLSAEIMRYSPWTHMQAPEVQRAGGLFSSALQGGALGAMYNPASAATAAAPEVGQLAGGAMLSPMAGNVAPWFNMSPQNRVPLKQGVENG